MPAFEDAPRSAISVRPVKRAHEQVADQLRDWILSGVLAVGDKLPGETALAEQFGTGRSTIREALRTLATEDLIRTRPGVGGGSVVQLPDPGHFRESFKVSLTMLIGTNDLTTIDLVRAREMLEAPTAAMAAANRTEEDIARLRSFIPEDPARLGAEAMFGLDRSFHEAILGIGGNRLLPMIVTPIYEVSARRFERSLAPSTFWEMVVADHTKIVDAIESSDSTLAEQCMRDHLFGMIPMYQELERGRSE